MDNLVNTDPIEESKKPCDDATDDVDAPPALIWTGKEWISRSVLENRDTAQWSVTNHTEDTLNSELDVGWRPFKTLDSKCEEKTVKFDICSLIDENNTPLFINSIAGLFFPSVYTLVMDTLKMKERTVLTLDLFDKLFDWQNRVMRSQTWLFNSCILVMIIVIFLLVTFVPSFNYKTNILNFFWFSMATSFLLFMCLSTSIWAYWVYPSKIFALRKEVPDDDIHTNGIKPSEHRSRHITGDSNRDSVCSGSANILKEDIGPGNMKMKAVYCGILTFLTLLPSMIGIFLYKYIPDNQIYIVNVDEQSNSILARVVGAINSFGFTDEFEPYNCTSDEFKNMILVENEILVINSSDLDMKQLSLGVGNTRMIIYVDDSSEINWRVSSSRKNPFEDIKIPVLIVRQRDWTTMNVNRKMLITKNNKYFQKQIQTFAKCSEDPRFFVKINKALDITPRKYLLENGTVFEEMVVKTVCLKDGRPCKHVSFGTQMVNIPCKNQSFNGIQIFNNINNLLKKEEVYLGDGHFNNYCCMNSSNFIQFYGNNCTISDIPSCHFSYYFKDGLCDEFGRQSYSSFCKVGTCVYKQVYQTYCNENRNLLRNCLHKKYSCIE